MYTCTNRHLYLRLSLKAVTIQCMTSEYVTVYIKMNYVMHTLSIRTTYAGYDRQTLNTLNIRYLYVKQTLLIRCSYVCKGMSSKDLGFTLKLRAYVVFSETCIHFLQFKTIVF